MHAWNYSAQRELRFYKALTLAQVRQTVIQKCIIMHAVTLDTKYKVAYVDQINILKPVLPAQIQFQTYLNCSTVWQGISKYYCGLFSIALT